MYTNCRGRMVSFPILTNGNACTLITSKVSFEIQPLGAVAAR